LRQYRSLQVLEAQINSCIRGFWLPFNLLGVLALTVVCATLILRVHPGLTMSGICGIVASSALTTQLLITYFASNIVSFSEEAMQQQWKKCRKRLELKELMACKPIGMKSGSFRILDRETMLIIMMANVDYTVSLSLLLVL
jgi:hypothetical protein